VIRSFEDKDTEYFFKTGKLPRKKGWACLATIAKRKLDMLHYAKDLKDLRTPPKNCLEKLAGDLKDYYSVRINDQWRLVFKWDLESFDVKIIDYHS
jgi:proteic killer suppression protein